jgi:cytochrome P450
MIRNPHCFQRARQEIDTVVGNDRLPDFSDRDHMPYMEAVVQETLRCVGWADIALRTIHLTTIVSLYRWFPIVAAGLAHVSTEDYVYKGMFIPKGSVIQANNRYVT